MEKILSISLKLNFTPNTLGCCGLTNPPPSDAVRKRKKNILEDLLSSVLLQLKKYHPSGNLNFNFLGIYKS